MTTTAQAIRALARLLFPCASMAACGGAVAHDPCGDVRPKWQPIAPPTGVDMEFYWSTQPHGASYSAVWYRDRVLFWGGYRRKTPGHAELVTSTQGAQYIPKTDEWKPWPPLVDGNPGTPRADHTAYLDGDGNMYVIGGETSGPGTISDLILDTVRVATGSVLKVVPGGRMWEPLSLLPALPAGSTPSFVLHPDGLSQNAYVFGLLGDAGPGTFGFACCDGSPIPGPDLLSLTRVEKADGTMFFGSTQAEAPDSPRVTGGTFDPSTRTWTPLATEGAPDPRIGHSLVNQVVWGGGSQRLLDSDARYELDPGSAGRWVPVSPNGAPSPRHGHAAVAIGRRMLIFGGTGADGVREDGGVYDPQDDTWTSLPTACAPKVDEPLALWTGKDRPSCSPGDSACEERVSRDYWNENAAIVWGTSPDDLAKGAGAVLLLPDDWR